jgi:uncharacterized membrane protein YbhN (UPF0104 family)
VSPSSPAKRFLAVAAAVGVVGIAGAFCVATAIREHERVADALGEAHLAWLAAALGLAAAAMMVVASGWRRCLAELGHPQPASTVLTWWFVGELGKYVPGGVWPVIGRGELARRGGVDRSAAYHSVGLSLAGLYGAAVLPVAVVVAHPAAQGVASRWLHRLTGGRVTIDVVDWARLRRLLVWYVLAWLLIAAVTAAVTAGYGAEVGWRAPAATVLAWFCGFVVVLAPAGAGVREAVFVATSGLDPGLAVTVAVTSRLAFVTVDLVGAVVAASRLRAAAPPALTTR